MRFFLLALVASCFSALLVSAESSADLVNAKVERTIDLQSHLAQITNVITVENTGSAPQKSYTFVVEPAHAKHVAFIGAQLTSDSKSGDAESRRLLVTALSQDSNKGALYRVDFRGDLAAGKSLSFEVELVLFNEQRAFPEEIAQNERQLVLFKSNVYYYSLYQTKRQSTTLNLASEKVESYTQLKPTSKTDSTIVYGPYDSVKQPFEFSELSVHFENNSPFLVVTNLVRTIEVSHWGNIAVEETIDMAHQGARLKGAFSRFDYMRRIGGAASVKSFNTRLPSTAADVYYRDEIGNISTSNLRTLSKSARSAGEPIDFEIRPRYPLFGGWRTHYTVGYNLPVYQYLFTKGNDYLLQMRLLDHIYDDQLIESATIKIILPEYSTNIEFLPPYSVDRSPNEIHYTYLDTVGRPVIVIKKRNAVENHIQDFKLKYKFNKLMILQEPLLIVAFFYLLFTVVIIAVRIDFSLTSKTEHVKKD